MFESYSLFTVRWIVTCGEILWDGIYQKPRGVLTYLAEWGCAALMGRFFYKKSLNMGPVFYPKNP